MTKILVVDDEADLEILIKQKFRQKSGSRNMNLFLLSMDRMLWINYLKIKTLTWC